MSIVIKGMKIPKHCGECGIEWCDRWKQLIIAGMSIAKTRPSDCPLVELPPHGRLIDADALTETTDGVWDCNDLYFQPNDKICDPNDCKGCKWRETMDCFRRMVKHAPTIIPAEEE